MSLAVVLAFTMVWYRNGLRCFLDLCRCEYGAEFFLLASDGLNPDLVCLGAPSLANQFAAGPVELL